MPKITTDEYLAQLAEGAKASPHMQSIQRWLGERDIGDVFSPSAMGLSKMEYLKRLAAINAPTQKYVGKIARKLLKPLREVGLIEDVAKEKGRTYGTTERAIIWGAQPHVSRSLLPDSSPDKMSLIKEQLKKKADIGFRPEEMRPVTAAHEPGHILARFLNHEEYSGLLNAFADDQAMNRLISRTNVAMHDPWELLAEAYAQYIGGDSFKEFPPFVKHLVKKYHKLLR